MLKFIVYEDEEVFTKKISKYIKEVMLKQNIDYQIEEYNKHNKKLLKTIEDNSQKIYIMDIEIPNDVSGIEVAKMIRSNDWNSIIILVTSHADLSYEALKAQIMLLDFISKFNDCEYNLKNAIKKALVKLNNKQVLVFETSDMLYRIYTDDIVYILRDSIDRKCLIKTDFNEIVINDTIANLLNMLDSRFFLSHRSCIVNIEKVNKIDWKNNIIYFRNGEKIDYLSRNKRKELKEYVGSC